MRVLIKSVISAMTVTAICAANICEISANSDVTAQNISVSAADVSEKGNGDTILNYSCMGVKDGYY